MAGGDHRVGVDYQGPIWDNHFHMDPAGRNVEALREFLRAGGTHVLLVHKPYDAMPGSSVEAHRKAFQITLDLASRARRETEAKVFVAVGPHPAELTELMKAGRTLDDASDVYRGALEAAADVVRSGAAVAMGEIGRPHYPVAPDVWARANELFEHALTLCKDLGCAPILHTESATPEVFADLARIGRKVGFAVERMVKHYSPPIVDTALNHGLFPSVLVGKDAVETALAQGTRFMMETDYMDDAARPGGVLGPKTVPRRTLDLVKRGSLSPRDAAIIHAVNPSKLYEITV